MQLNNKVALVTGGAVRVGRAIALALAAEGMNVGVHYHLSEARAREVKREIEAMGREALLLQGDFAKVDDIRDVVERCAEHFKRLDVLINNAAIYYHTPLEETTEEQWDDLLRINLKAPFFCAQAASRWMRKQGAGKIVNIADVSGFVPWPGYIPYCASKAGVISITRSLAMALAPEIQVNAVAPGTVLARDDATPEEIEELKKLSLLQKIGTPADVANAVIFLLKGSDFVTGSVIAVDGGHLLV